MGSVKCPNCGKKDFYFDSPTLYGFHLIYKNGVAYFIDVEREERVRKTLERTTVFESEVSDKAWAWTCFYCDDIIDSTMKEWKQLKRIALEFLSW